MSETPLLVVSNENETQPPEIETFFNSLVGIGQASILTGRSKGQIGRDANTKRLPFTLDDKGQKRYRVSDLSMIYGLKRPDETKKETVSQKAERPHEIPTETAVELALLRQQVQHQADQLRRVEDENRDLRQTRDRLLDQTHRLTLLLPAPEAEPEQPIETPASEQPPPPLPWYKRWFK